MVIALPGYDISLAARMLIGCRVGVLVGVFVAVAVAVGDGVLLGDGVMLGVWVRLGREVVALGRAVTPS